MKFSPQPKPTKKEKPKYDLRKAMQLKAKNKKLVAKMKTPKESVSKLKKNLDKVFNQFIRLRDRGKPCISCGKIATISNPHQAGHYHSCRYLSIRWNEQNVAGQCLKCNIFDQGNFRGYTEGMIKKYGQNTLDYLEIKRHNKSKLTAFELKLLIEEYESKVKYLKT